jgi:hypothetical protein
MESHDVAGRSWDIDDRDTHGVKNADLALSNEMRSHHIGPDHFPVESAKSSLWLSEIVVLHLPRQRMDIKVGRV